MFYVCFSDALWEGFAIFKELLEIEKGYTLEIKKNPFAEIEINCLRTFGHTLSLTQ